MSTPPEPLSTFATVRLLLRFSIVRSKARARRQKQIFQQRGKNPGIDLAALHYPLMFLFGLVLHILFAISLVNVVSTAETVALRDSGQMIVGWPVMRALDDLKDAREKSHEPGPDRQSAILEAEKDLDRAFIRESHDEERQRGLSEEDYLENLRIAFRNRGDSAFSRPASVGGSMAVDIRSSRSQLPAFAGALMLLWWFVMLTFQGEGLELDVQRRRHPMWEWFFSHPVRPGAVFLAEMLAPLSANPNLLLAPVFWIIVLAMSGMFLPVAFLCGTWIGLVFAIAAACLNKSIEISAMLRLAPRNRSAVLGIMSWLGFVASISVFAFLSMDSLVESIVEFLAPVAWMIPPPVFGWLIGALPGAWSIAGPILFATALGAIVIAFSVRTAARSTERGLAGGASQPPKAAKILEKPEGTTWLGDPLYRKELLWFWRDRGAVVQAILIPASVAAIQLINLHGIVRAAAGQWHMLCTLAVAFGTYFLFILGPRSLISEGAALWIPLTWPRGMENLLKAKARLWAMLANIPVGLGLILALFLFPKEWWKIALVGLGWWLFCRSLALKSVTLVQAQKESGEVDPVPAGRRMAAWLGTFAFASGVATQQWHLAMVGVVYSWLTAAAMWQNFRARIPYLYDPWSERAPRPPTVMTGMVAVMIMIEIVALTSTLTILIAGRDRLGLALAVAYGLSASLVAVGTTLWLRRHDIQVREIWSWPDSAETSRIPLWETIFLGGATGAALGWIAKLYTATLSSWWPEAAEHVRSSGAYFEAHGDQLYFFAFFAVVCAPLAEEFLFRGILYRALDQEWGKWRAILGSAAFFTIYHPVMGWPMVFAMGVLAAWLFRKTGRLWPAVAAHAAYNLVVVIG